MDGSPLLDGLNDAQREAVASPARRLLVLAGAGSGKTRVLVHRIAWLVGEQGVPPAEILAVTFTNKAAREMRGRIEELMGATLRGMWVGTFHGLAHRLLRRHWREAGLDEGFQIIDSDDQLQLIKRIGRRLELDEELWPARRCQGFINRRRDDGERAQHIEHRGSPDVRVLLEVYQAYQEACGDRLVDFGDILLRAVELWRDHPEILDLYRRRFRHVLVDEFQDTNAVQYAWLRLLAADGNHLMVVGDDDQSIYGWRGARVENIQRFAKKDFRDAETVRLERNYRSTSNILEAANSLIDNNRGRLGKRLWTEDRAGEPIGLFEAYNGEDEAAFIAERIAEEAAGGRPRRDMAALYRSNAQSRALEEALLRAGVPYRIYGGQRFYDRMEVRNAMAYLRLVAGRDDDAALERVINTPTRGIGQSTVEALRREAAERGCSLWRAAAACVREDRLRGRERAVKAFLELIDAMAAECAALAELHGELPALPMQARLVIERSKLKEHHGKEGAEIAKNRIENLDELVIAAGAFDPGEAGDEEDAPAASALTAFLNHASLDTGGATGGAEGDAAQLMTLHSAKGLEFPVVFLAGLEEGLFPHRNAVEEGNLEEERRLCYVGVTRAREKLWLCHASSRRLYGGFMPCKPSRFIREIPDELIEPVRPGLSPAPGRRARRRRREAPVVPDWSPEGALTPGQRVAHHRFGEGTVLDYEDRGGDADRVRVGFDRAGVKWLVLSLARLTVLDGG